MHSVMIVQPLKQIPSVFYIHPYFQAPKQWDQISVLLLEIELFMNVMLLVIESFSTTLLFKKNGKGNVSSCLSLRAASRLYEYERREMFYHEEGLDKGDFKRYGSPYSMIKGRSPGRKWVVQASALKLVQKLLPSYSSGQWVWVIIAAV